MGQNNFYSVIVDKGRIAVNSFTCVILLMAIVIERRSLSRSFGTWARGSLRAHPPCSLNHEASNPCGTSPGANRTGAKTPLDHRQPFVAPRQQGPGPRQDLRHEPQAAVKFVEHPHIHQPTKNESGARCFTRSPIGAAGLRLRR